MSFLEFSLREAGLIKKFIDNPLKISVDRSFAEVAICLPFFEPAVSSLMQ